MRNSSRWLYVILGNVRSSTQKVPFFNENLSVTCFVNLSENKLRVKRKPKILHFGESVPKIF